MGKRVRAKGAVRPNSSTKLPASRSRDPRSSSMWRRDLRSGTAFAALFALGLVSAVSPAKAQTAVLPTGGTVTHGTATISGGGGGLLIDQTSGSAIISWDTFSIGAGGSTHFNNGSGATLNRVTGNVPSQIDGSLSATGSLFLVNQAGVVVGTGGMVATGGSFYASTQNVSNADFLDGGNTAFKGSSKAGIVNHGTIASAMGDVALIARRVENTGDISAPNGTAALLAGYDVLMRETAGPNGKFLVRAGGSDTAVVNSGTINAAEVELRANGGNVLALAGNTKGVIKATGVAKRGGRIFLTAGGGKVHAGGRMTARRRVTSGNPQRGGDVFINADTVLASGHIDVSGLAEVGGNIDIGGRDIALRGATLNASGTTGGGRIRVGGEYQGGKGLTVDQVENAETLLIDPATTLSADGKANNAAGGTVIAWSDDTTTFAGRISATGRRGGFAEVSGKSTLTYTGRADLRDWSGGAGTLLLDPTDYTIGAAEAATITANLATANVVIATDSAGAGNGDIFVNSALAYNSANSLTLLAHRHIEANASIQNAGTGDLNLVAGWDGTTQAPPAPEINSPAGFDLAAFIATANSYGNGGDIFIGDGAQISNISLGTKGGTTTALARDLHLAGSANGNGAAQLGFFGSATGAIDVMLTHDLTATGGSGSTSYAQVGHGGFGINASVSADISVDAGGDLVFTAGSDFATYAKLGHGGLGANGSHSGAIEVSADNLTFTGGSGSAASAHIGHGGRGSDGSHSGSITIAARNDMTFTGGSGSAAAVLIGHGDRTVDGNHSGSITVAADDVTLMGGSGSTSYVQLGHGGSFTSGNYSGAISLDLTGDLSLIGGSDANGFAQIGHGNSLAGATGNRSGDISAVVRGMTTFTANTGGYWFGHSTTTAGGVSNANVALVTNGLAVNGGNFTQMILSDLLGGDVLIANTAPATTPGGGFANQGTDDIIFDDANLPLFTSAHDLTLAARGDIVMLSSVRNQGAGGINLLGGWNGATGLDLSGFPMLDMNAVETAGAFGAAGGDVYIGDGSQTQEVLVGTRMGDIHVLAHDLEVKGSHFGFGAGARLGFRSGPVAGIDSDIRIVAMDDVLVEGGDADFAYAAIGHDGVESSDLTHGDITIVADTANDNELAVSGGDGEDAYAQIGHEGCCGPASGNIAITGQDIFVEGGFGEDASAQIGHNFQTATGNINLSASGDLAITGGDSEFTYAQIGHIGDTATGNIDVMVNGSALLLSGFDEVADAQIGHDTDTMSAGDISVDIGETLTITGLGLDAFATIGHLGFGDASGDIDVTAGGSIIVGTLGFGTGGQIGHLAQGDNSGDIMVEAGDNLLIGNLLPGSFAKIGHGSWFTTGNASGDIDVTAGGWITLYGGLIGPSYAQIGHGDPLGLSTGTRQGDISVVATGAMTIDDGFIGGALAWIGHGTASAGGISKADVYLEAFSFDRSLLDTVAAGDLGTFNKDILVGNIAGGDFTLVATGSGLLLQDPVYNSPHDVKISVNNDLVLDTNAVFVNGGTGDIILAAGGDFHNDTGSATPITTGGRWLVYSTRPDNNRNDVEVTNWDFLRYGTTFDINNPYVGTGNGFVYSVAPVVNFTVSSVTTQYGGVISPTITQTVTVNGVQVNAGEFGLGINPATSQFTFATFVTLDASGRPVVGFYDNGLVTFNEFLPYFGMTFTTTPGDLTILAGPTDPIDPIIPIDPIDPIDPIGPTTVSEGIGEMCAFRSDTEDPDEDGPSYDRIIELCGIVESDKDG